MARRGAAASIGRTHRRRPSFDTSPRSVLCRGTQAGRVSGRPLLARARHRSRRRRLRRRRMVPRCDAVRHSNQRANRHARVPGVRRRGHTHRHRLAPRHPRRPRRRLDAGGYARYDFRTANRLHQLGDAVQQRLGGSVTSLGTATDPRAVEAALDALPGWGPTTVRIFLRELRDVWPGAKTRLDRRTLDAAQHLELPISREGTDDIGALRTVARRAHLDPRDLEAALVRLALAHRDMRNCPGAGRCTMLTADCSRAGRACRPISAEHRL